jgi:tetratricopeptide (TPR) repeat protein
MRVKTTFLLLLFGLSMVTAEIQFHVAWQVSGDVTDVHVTDLNGDGYKEILLGTGDSYKKMLGTPTGSVIADICEGTLSQYGYTGALLWEKKVCKNDAASDPCYSNGCISAIHADSICTTTSKLLFVGCCYCGTSSIIRIYNTNGVLLQELYDDDGAGNPVNIPGCIRKILVEDIDADNCKEVIAVTNLEVFIYDTDCITCTIPTLPALRTRDLAVADRPTNMIYDVIVVNFDDDVNLTKEIVVAAEEVSVYEHDLTLKWKYEIVASDPVKSVYAFDIDSDTAAHEIDQDPDLEPELIVGESWYIYVLDNIEYGDTIPANDDPDLKWEYSTSPYDVNTVTAGAFFGPRNVMGGAATLVYVLDYNGTLLQTFNAPSEVRKLVLADFDKDGQNELTVFCDNYISVFSTTGVVWSSGNFQGRFIDGVVTDLNLDGTPEIVGGYTLGLYTVSVGELEAKTGLEAENLYDSAKELMEKGDFVRAVILFEQARAKYEKAQNTFMDIQCQKRILECEKFMDTDRLVAAALEELRNYGYENAGYLFSEAANLFAKMGDKSKMSQMHVLREASEKLREAHATLEEAHYLLLDKEYMQAGVEATWANHSFEDVSSLFLTMTLDSLYETLKLETSARIRECEDVIQLSALLAEADTMKAEADEHAHHADHYFTTQQYAKARSEYDKAQTLYTEAAKKLDEIQLALGKRADSFRRDIDDVEKKIKTLETSELYKTYEDIETAHIVSHLEEKKSVYNDLIDEYEDFAESIGRTARDCRSKAEKTYSQASQSHSFGDEFFEYAYALLQPPTSIAIGLACLIVALIGLAAGKGRYIALVFLVLILIFLGVSALQVIQ